MKSLLIRSFALLLVAGWFGCDSSVTILPYDISRNVVDLNLAGNASAATIAFDTTAEITLRFQIQPGGIVKVDPKGCEILDSSGFGYADALAEGTEILPGGDAWVSNSLVLSTTVGSAGQFTNAGIRFLAFRIPKGGVGFEYGWFQLECSQNGTRLHLIEFAINHNTNASILTGQAGPAPDSPGNANKGLVATTLDIIGSYRETADPDSSLCTMMILESDDPAYDYIIRFFPFMWPWPDIKGKVENGKLLIPSFSYTGNIPTPGGADRPFAASIYGKGIMEISGEQISLTWQIDYDKTGFSAEKFHGPFTMYKCD